MIAQSVQTPEVPVAQWSRIDFIFFIFVVASFGTSHIFVNNLLFSSL